MEGFLLWQLKLQSMVSAVSAACVCGLGCIGDYLVCRCIHFFINAHYDGGIDIFTRRSDDDFFCAVIQMYLAIFFALEFAGAVDYDIHTQLSPGQIFGITVG